MAKDDADAIPPELSRVIALIASAIVHGSRAVNTGHITPSNVLSTAEEFDTYIRTAKR